MTGDEIKSLNIFILIALLLFGIYIITNNKVENFEDDIIQKLDEYKLKNSDKIIDITEEDLYDLLKNKRIALAEINDGDEDPNSVEKFGFYYPIYNTPLNNIWYSKLRYYNQGYGWVPYDYRYNYYPTRRYLRPDFYIQPYGRGRWVRHFKNYYYTW